MGGSKILKNPKVLLGIFATLFGLSFLVYLLPWNEVWKALRSSSPRAFTFGFLLYSLSYLFRTLRWKVYYGKAPLGYLFLTTAVNTFLNNTVPFRLGELSVFGFLRRYDSSVKETLKKFLKVRLYDGIALLTLLAFSLLFVKTENPLLSLLISVSIYPSVVYLLKFFSFGKLPHLGFEWRVYALSVGALLSKLLGVYLFLEHLGLDFFRFSVGFLGGEISSILPINAFANLGTYEGSFSLATALLLGENFKRGMEVGFLSHIFLLLSSALLGLVSLPTLLRR